MSGSGNVEHMLRQVTPGRYDAYEALLRALATPSSGQIWMLLWHGQAGSPDAQYGNMEVDGFNYAPCVTSAQELSASGWNRSYEVVDGLDVARTLYPDHYGLWLNPHAPGGGVGIPWLDLRRIATGLERQPAGPLRLSEPAIEIPQFYALLTQNAHRTPAVLADHAHDGRVHRAAQHHLDDVHGFVVRDAQAVRELGLDAHAIEHGVDLRSPTMHHDDADAHVAQQTHVFGEALFERLVDHRVAAAAFGALIDCRRKTSAASPRFRFHPKPTSQRAGKRLDEQIQHC